MPALTPFPVFFHLCTPDGLLEFHGKLQLVDSGTNFSDKYTDTFPIKTDVFGYLDRVNGIEQTYLHPDLEKRIGLRISALEAFQEKLFLLSRIFGPETYMAIEFSTVKEPASGNLFNAPVFWGWGTDSACIAAGGAYWGKIESVEFGFPISYNISGESEPLAELTYGGATVFREATPGFDIMNKDGNIEVVGEFNSWNVCLGILSGILSSQQSVIPRRLPFQKITFPEGYL
ncbi:hypothetical protein ACJJIG_11220 [Microbulbifer sp. SSSA007]|uniref:hypothetical protein n=1 Tax=Microbulbifer sp. SSSA007 TaxID=3243379 RepID=UPI0040396C03